MADAAANDITEAEVTALAGRFAAWAGALPQRDQEILWQMLQTVAASGDDAQGYAAPPYPVPGWRMPVQSSGPSSAPNDWNREADFSYAFLSTFGRIR